MNSLILCEGATDAILLSYYLKKVSGWTYTAKAPDGLNIRSTRGNESVNWYKRGNDYLLICGVGGKDNFTGFFHQSLENPIIHAGAFEIIAVITDRDISASYPIMSYRNTVKACFLKSMARSLISCMFTTKILQNWEQPLNGCRWNKQSCRSNKVSKRPRQYFSVASSINMDSI